MTRLLSHIINDQHFVLSGERTLFWEDQSMLIVADLHIGKTGHFRKSGINVPQSVYKDDLHRLLAQILFFKADKLMIAGDLSHSIANRELNLFVKWRNDYQSLTVHLARGNHDILQSAWYKEAAITVHEEAYELGGFAFVHDITKTKEPLKKNLFYFSGHVHPFISMSGRGRQSLQFPCFYFSKHYCILPAFSRFTGGYRIEPSKDDKVFGLAEKEIFEVGSNVKC